MLRAACHCGPIVSTGRETVIYVVGLAVDNSGNVSVTGDAFDGNNYVHLTIKYSGAGVALWTNYGNEVSAITADSSGNVFVTGLGTVAYSSAGVPLWTNSYGHGSAIAADSSGNVFVTGSGTVAYSSAGVPLWTNISGGSAIATDSSGNAIVTGVSFGDYVTIKYSKAGVPLWTNVYAGPGSGQVVLPFVAVDSSGNVFIAGESGLNGNYDFVTVAYSGTGSRLWTNAYGGPANENDMANAIAVDKSGNVFVAGRTDGNSSSADYVTIKYSNAGAPLWTNRYNGPANLYDEVTAIAVDASGSVFVTGNSGYGVSADYATLAYSSTGVALWTNCYNGPGNGADYARAVAVDSNGNLFVTGESFGSSSASDFATIKYSSSIGRLAIERDGSDGLFIRYTGAPDVTYRLQRAASVTGAWSDLATNTAPASGLIEYHETSPPPGQAFYRTVQP